MSSEEKDFGTIVDLLKKDYLSKTENNLKQKTGEIIQDFIDRGLYNTTACTGKQLQAHFDHIDEIIDHILESLKQDFADIPLEQVKEKLLTIVDEEYKKLISFASSHLVNAGLAQQSTLESFERLINNKKEKAKQAIETKFAILEKKRTASKNKKEAEEKEGVLEAKPPEILQKILWVMRYGRKHWKLILLALFLWGIFVWPKLDFLSKFYHPTKKESLNDYGRTKLYARTKKRIDDIYENIENEQLNPWILINTGKMRQVTKHDGKVISYKGVMFEGTPRHFFWSDDFIPPFIEDAIVKIFDQTIEECRRNNLDPKAYIDEANMLLSGFIFRVYNHMADIDRRLLGEGDIKGRPRKDVSLEVEKMQKFLKEHYAAAVLLASKNEDADKDPYQENKNSTDKKWYKKVSAKLVTVIVLLTALTTFILNLDKIMRKFRGETENQAPSSKQLEESKLEISLRKIFQDIESRPLVQQEETAKHYVGMRLKDQELELFVIHTYPEEGRFGLTMVMPGQSDITFLEGIRVHFYVDSNQYPQLNAAKKGLKIYVTGKIEDATRLSVKLSDVSLKFD